MHWELEKASYPNEDSGMDVDWMGLVKKYLVPGMLVLAVVGVVLYTTSGVDLGTGNMFQDIGGSMFNIGQI